MRPTGAGSEQAIVRDTANDTYSSWAAPIVRDGYYGYNAPNHFCENRPVQIVSAWYGTGNERWNVTKLIKHMVNTGSLNIMAANKTFGGDPPPERPKILTLTFIYDGETKRLQIPEDRMLQLP
jgi:hypothetical protein